MHKIINMAGIYIHIPFCKKRCIYCDFYSTTLGHLKDRYINAVEKEIEIRKDYAGNETVETIYFGGGTPSQLKSEDIKMIISAINKVHNVKNNAEITIEANPDDLTEEYVNALKSTGVNRISIGIQTFNYRRLKFLNRRHNAQQAKDAVKRCQDKGFDNISIDLIYGFPDESTEQWINDIDTALELGIQHISAYHLIYEEGTKLYSMLEKNELCELDEEKSVEQFKILIQKLKEGGFVHYEISNFCMPGKESRHNSSYWKDKKYIGIGPSAHSYNLDCRQWNISDLEKYMKLVENGETFFEKEELTKEEHYNDYILTSLRTMWGADLNLIKKKFGEKLYGHFISNAGKYINNGEMRISDGMAIICDNGIFISDGIMSDLMWVE